MRDKVLFIAFVSAFRRECLFLVLFCCFPFCWFQIPYDAVRSKNELKRQYRENGRTRVHETILMGRGANESCHASMKTRPNLGVNIHMSNTMKRQASFFIRFSYEQIAEEKELDG